MRASYIALYFLFILGADMLVDNPAKAEDYFPLPKGASWEYRDTNGRINKVEVVGPKNIDGRSAIYVRDQSGEYRYYIKTANSIVLYASSFRVFGDDYLILKIPPKKGEEYNVGGGVGTVVTIIDTSAIVKVPAGVFKNCVVKKMYSPSASDAAKKLTGGKVDAHYVIDYFAPDIGLIKRENLFSKGAIEIKLEILEELVKYKAP